MGSAIRLWGLAAVSFAVGLRVSNRLRTTVYAGNGQLVIAEERRQSLVIVDIPMDGDGKLSPDGALSRDQYPALALALGKEDNKGLEGLAYDLEGDRLFVTKERDPRQLLEERSSYQLGRGAFPARPRPVQPGERQGVCH